MKKLVVVSLMAVSVASCNSSTAQRSLLPDAPKEFGKPVKLPAVIAGKSLRVLILEHRGALMTANRRLMNDDQFYSDVLRQFSARH